MEQPRQDTGLGDLIDVFKPKISSIILGFFLCAFLVALSAAAIGFPLHAAYLAGWNLPMRRWLWVGALCLLGFGLIVGAIFLALYCRRLLSYRVEVYTNGFRYLSNQSAAVVLWAEVKRVIETLTFMEIIDPFSKKTVVTASVYTLVTVSGKEYEVNSRDIEAIEQFRIVLWEQAVRFSLPWETVQAQGKWWNG